MKSVRTADGSTTYYSEEFKEHYHSTTGALEESFKKFVIPSLKDKLEQEHIKLLDICFGIGYNTACAIHYIKANNPRIRIEIVGLENDPAIVRSVKDLEVPRLISEEYDILRKLPDSWQVNQGRVQVRLVLDDAAQGIKGLEGFDAVFLDPFSPEKCPSLWQEDFIQDIYSALKKGGVLTTYSCARIVRDNLRKAGFVVKDGPRVGRRSPSTIAFKE